MAKRDEERASRLEAYLDGQLNPAERASVEAEIQRDPSLRALVERQERIDAGLRRLFAPPAAPELVFSEADASENGVAGRVVSGEVPGTRTGERAARSAWRRPWVALVSLAAVLALAVGAWWALAPDPSTELDELQSLLEGRVAWQPMQVCTTGDAFEDWTARRFGQPLRPGPGADRIELVGWRYDRTLSSNTGILLARVGGTPLFVLMDHERNDRNLAPPREHSELRVHRRVVGDVVMYEVSPFESPAVLEAIVIPEE